jgi:hypothetical protein
MEEKETPRMRKHGESKTAGIVMANVRHGTCNSRIRKFQADGFLTTFTIITTG